MLLSSPLLFMNITNDTADGGLEHRIWSTLAHITGVFRVSPRACEIIYVGGNMVVRAVGIQTRHASSARAFLPGFWTRSLSQ